MPSPIAKYRGENDPRHNGRLHWPGLNGFPVRGEHAPLLTKEEQKKLQPIGEVHVEVFDLSDPVQKQNYIWVRDHWRNGHFTIEHEYRHWNAATNNMLVYIEWTQIYYQQTNGRTDHAEQNGQGFTLKSGLGSDSSGRSADSVLRSPNQQQRPAVATLPANAGAAHGYGAADR